MKDNPEEWVVDASVGIKLFVAEPLSEQADSLFLRLAADPPAMLWVPDLFFVEWKYVRRFKYPRTEARESVAALTRLGLRSVATENLVDGALQIAVAEGVTAYDACYLALSLELKAPFVTADEALVRKLRGTRFQVQWLKDLSFSRPPA